MISAESRKQRHRDGRATDRRWELRCASTMMRLSASSAQQMLPSCASRILQRRSDGREAKHFYTQEPSRHGNLVEMGSSLFITCHFLPVRPSAHRGTLLPTQYLARWQCLSLLSLLPTSHTTLLACTALALRIACCPRAFPSILHSPPSSTSQHQQSQHDTIRYTRSPMS